MGNGSFDPRNIHIDFQTLERLLRRKDDGVNQMLLEQLKGCPECRQVAVDLYARYQAWALDDLPGADLLVVILSEAKDPGGGVAPGGAKSL